MGEKGRAGGNSTAFAVSSQHPALMLLHLLLCPSDPIPPPCNFLNNGFHHFRSYAPLNHGRTIEMKYFDVAFSFGR